ncbi:copper-translocating P-type ATPase [Campylobacter iguaniorum]|uniref:Copper-transporting ATPase n=1 Tax=Campylobacter iguaniorum TaxID=1244531 RepID=A0A076F9N1_9BACT|nr:heavy metal translocating P-type ATPase [Campylobacter iguaniorum]AII14393.1 copper-translocating P-type ATPase [Campylobacter iguaniorum]
MINKVKFNITGMTCVNCANSIEKSVKKLNGVVSSKVSFADSSAVFELDQNADLSLIKNKIKKLGFGVAQNYDELQISKQKNLANLRNKFIISAVLSSLIMIFEMSGEASFAKSLGLLGLASIVIFYCGLSFYTHAISSVKSLNFDMNVLISLGTFMAYGYSLATFLAPNLIPENMKYLYFSGSAMIITFVLLGKFLEERSKLKAGNYIKSLMDLSPKTALVLKPDGQSLSVLASELKINDIVVVKNGYNVPCDGVIVSGGAEIDTSALSGESLPVFKSAGDLVHAGTLNTNGYINIKVTKEPNDTLLAQILELLANASSQKMPISRLADKVANIFVPSVILIAIITFLVWGFFGDLTRGLLSAISVLIISCPCALGLATPIAIISGISWSAKNAILIKNPEIMEIIHLANCAVFDKTGTLTKGEISVAKTNLNTQDLKLIVNLEKLSEHPISKAIVDYAPNLIDKDIKFEFENIPGMGISANSSQILVGNEALLKLKGIKIQMSDEINEALERGFGMIYVALNSKFSGYIAISDTIKEDAKQTIEALKELGITPVMLTGDNQKTANLVAQSLGIEKVIAGVLPSDKYKAINELKSEHKKVIFVGDGINDALALKAADISIAMSSGSDIAKDIGDIVLIKNDLSSVANAINLASKTMQTIKENLAWAFIYNIICIPVAAGVLYPVFGLVLTPMYAAFAMSISSLSVVLNSLKLRLLKF